MLIQMWRPGPSRTEFGHEIMKTRHSIVVLSCTLLLAGCKGESESLVRTDSDSEIRIGMTREQVVKESGQPTAKQEYVKSDEPVWGVIEGWISDLENGDKIEIWDYRRSKGTFSVYFLNDSEEVWHTSFAGKDVRF
jgi:hypothetical protein